MLTQKPPEANNSPIKHDNLNKDIEEVFQSVSGYKIRYTSYIKSIIVVTIIGWIIAFALYSVLWIITNNSIDQYKNGTSILSNQDYIPITDKQFWFGLIILSFPTILLLFLINYLPKCII